MKRNVISALIILLLGTVTLRSQETPNNVKKAGNLTVTVVGFENDKGNVKIALVNSKENFSEKDNPFRKALAAIKDKKAKLVFKNIPFGEYAVKVYHDENKNNKLDKSFVGLPKEKYGFSNNAGVNSGRLIMKRQSLLSIQKIRVSKLRWNKLTPKPLLFRRENSPIEIHG